MSVQIDGLSELIVAAQVATWVGTGLFLLIGFLLLYWLVRPPRRRERKAQPPLDGAELAQLVARMEERIDTLERLVAAEHDKDRIESGATPVLRREE